MTRIFFDTEFSSFRRGRLLSVGLAAQDRRELYVEIAGDGADRDVSAFVRAHVLTQFGLVPGSAVGTPAALGARVVGFLRGFGTPVELCFDFALDERLLREAIELTGARSFLRAAVTFRDVAGEATGDPARAAARAARQASAPLRLHHALADARALRAGWLAQNGADRWQRHR